MKKLLHTYRRGKPPAGPAQQRPAPPDPYAGMTAEQRGAHAWASLLVEAVERVYGRGQTEPLVSSCLKARDTRYSNRDEL